MMVLRVAIYCRVSTDEQANNFSLETQLEACRRFCEHIGFEVIHVFLEEHSGMDINRPELVKLRQLVRQRAIDVLVVYASDRYTRNPRHGGELRDELFANSVRLFYAISGREVRDNADDELISNVEDSFNRHWWAKIVEGMNRGKRGKAEAGIYVGAGRPPYGYVKVGQKRETRLEVNEPQAKIVRQIFYWYAHERVSVVGIIHRLEGVPTPGDDKGYYARERRSGEWGPSTIYAILSDTAYVGSLVFYRTTDHPIRVSVPAIIDERSWQLTEQRLEAGRQMSVRGTKYQYLMARRLKCSCGYRMITAPTHEGGTVRLYYRCPSVSRNTSRPYCRLPHFRSSLVDDAVWEWVIELMRHPKALRAKLKESQHELEQRNADLRERIATIDRRIEKQSRKLELLLEECADDASEQTKHIFRRARVETEELFAELNAERKDLVAQLETVTISDEYIDDLEHVAANVEGKLENADFQRRRELVEDLNLWGTLAVENGAKVLYIHLYTHKFRLLLHSSSSS